MVAFWDLDCGYYSRLNLFGQSVLQCFTTHCKYVSPRGLVWSMRDRILSTIDLSDIESLSSFGCITLKPFPVSVVSNRDNLASKKNNSV